MSNPILKDMADLIWTAAPELRVYGVSGPGKDDAGYDLWRELWAGIKPIKYGNSVTWSDDGQLYLARYQIPQDTYHCVLRVETYTINYTAAATDLSVPAPPPPGTAYWQLQQLGTTAAQTITDPDAPVQTMANCEEFLILEGGYFATLILNLSSAPPNSQAREVRTLVYGYDITGDLAERIGSNQAVMTIS